MGRISNTNCILASNSVIKTTSILRYAHDINATGNLGPRKTNGQNKAKVLLVRTPNHVSQYMEAGIVAKIVMCEVISRSGILAEIHSDRWRQIKSNLFHELCSMLQGEQLYKCVCFRSDHLMCLLPVSVCCTQTK